ncbi:MAG: lytic transglycosylase domain-containing protein [Bryobacteraceae bacterium]|nr:lytic transglycosylase domain-containing protein [Bryobacteraceae bacterium]
MRSPVLAALLAAAAAATAQAQSAPPSSKAQFESIQKQWAAIQIQHASAERHRSLTVPEAAEPAQPAVASRLSCAPVPSPSLDAMIRRSSTRHRIEPSLIEAVVRQESGGFPCALSPKGAMGLMQLMPSTAVTLGVDNPFEPESNLDGGVRFLRGLLDRYHGDLALALGAYNAGPRRVDEFGAVPPIPETQAYVRSVLDRAGLAATSLGSLD